MSGALKKVLGILVILLVGMLLIYSVVNVIFPNAMDQVIGVVETSIYRMTSFKIDIDGNGTVGTVSADEDVDANEAGYGGSDDKVSGWGDSLGTGNDGD